MSIQSGSYKGKRFLAQNGNCTAKSCITDQEAASVKTLHVCTSCSKLISLFKFNLCMQTNDILNTGSHTVDVHVHTYILCSNTLVTHYNMLRFTSRSCCCLLALSPSSSCCSSRCQFHILSSLYAYYTYVQCCN